MHLRTQKTLDNYVGGLGIALLRPAAMLLGAVLRRDHTLTVRKDVVWVKMLGGGSLVLAMPMLLGFRRAHPGVKMVLVTTPAVKPFAELLGVFDEYRMIDNRGLGNLLPSAFRALMRSMRADCIVDLEVHSRLTTVFTTLTMARNRVSFWLEDIFWRRGLASHLVFFNRSSGSYHFYDRIADVFESPVADRLECRAELFRVCEIPNDQARKSGQVSIGCACSDLGRERMLTPAQWVMAFREHLRPEHRRFVFLGGRGDRERTQDVIDALGHEFPSIELENRCGDLSLPQSVTVLSESAEFWGIDSSLLHLARIVGSKCVSYWGPTDPQTRLREDSRIEEHVHYRKIACSPCVHTTEEPPCRGDNRCIQGLFQEPVTLTRRWTPMEAPGERSSFRQIVAGFAHGAWRNIGFVAVALVLVYCLVHVFDPPRLNWGDSNSDYNVMVAGRNFARYGFIHMKFTPVLLDAPLLQMPDDRILIYTHYPQLPDVMNGVLRVVFGMTELTQFRIVALAFSFAALFFVYQIVSTYWGRRVGQIALALWVVNPIWIQHADYLHHAPYGAFFGFGSVYFLVQYLRRNERPRELILAGVFLFFTVLASYDYWFFAPLLLAMVAMERYRLTQIARATRVLATLALFAVVAALLKFGTNAWALGGIQAFLADMRMQYSERATDTVVRTAFDHGIMPTAAGRIDRFFSFLLFPVAVLWAAFPFVRRRWGAAWSNATNGHPNPWWLFAATLPFLWLFRELWIGQYYPVLLVLPFYAVACASAVALLLAASHRAARAVGAAVFAALLLNSVSELATFKKAYFRPDTIRDLHARLDRVSVPGQRILINHVFDGFYRYYFDRETIPLILTPPRSAQTILAALADPVSHPRSGTTTGTVFVQHKHLTDEMFDNGYYYILARYGLWSMWGNPPKYRPVIDALITERDSTLVSKVGLVGERLYETDDYVLWRLKPTSSVTQVSQRP
jgi:ADP-heptose:LPS heptosyltransferase